MRLRLLPSALLVVVVCAQLWLVRSEGLSPWSGGGFGMFSTLDAGGLRHVHAFALRPGVRRELAVPPRWHKAERRARTFPSEARLRELARRLTTLATPDEGALQAIRIEVWGTGHDPNTLAPRGRLVRAREFTPDEL